MLTATKAPAPNQAVVNAVIVVARQHGWHGEPHTLPSWLDTQLRRPAGKALCDALARASTTWDALEREVNHALESRKIRTDLVTELTKSMDERMQAVAHALVIDQPAPTPEPSPCG